MEDCEASPQVNAATGGTRGLMKVKVDEITAQVQELTEELARLRERCECSHARKQSTEVVCWYVVSIRHNYPHTSSDVSRI